ncbi:hypothetical protein JXB41_02995 [Candidatus Woesearchaeota archaeon]|nr:hypothetical protein [Candidatus Woesearchaeota archaeon]
MERGITSPESVLTFAQALTAGEITTEVLRCADEIKSMYPSLSQAVDLTLYHYSPDLVIERVNLIKDVNMYTNGGRILGIGDKWFYCKFYRDPEHAEKDSFALDILRQGKNEILALSDMLRQGEFIERIEAADLNVMPKEDLVELYNLDNGQTLTRLIERFELPLVPEEIPLLVDPAESSVRIYEYIQGLPTSEVISFCSEASKTPEHELHTAASAFSREYHHHVVDSMVAQRALLGRFCNEAEVFPIGKNLAGSCRKLVNYLYGTSCSVDLGLIDTYSSFIDDHFSHCMSNGLKFSSSGPRVDRTATNMKFSIQDSQISPEGFVRCYAANRTPMIDLVAHFDYDKSEEWLTELAWALGQAIGYEGSPISTEEQQSYILYAYLKEAEKRLVADALFEGATLTSQEYKNRLATIDQLSEECWSMATDFSSGLKLNDEQQLFFNRFFECTAGLTPTEDVDELEYRTNLFFCLTNTTLGIRMYRSASNRTERWLRNCMQRTTTISAEALIDETKRAEAGSLLHKLNEENQQIQSFIFELEKKTRTALNYASNSAKACLGYLERKCKGYELDQQDHRLRDRLFHYHTLLYKAKVNPLALGVHLEELTSVIEQGGIFPFEQDICHILRSYYLLKEARDNMSDLEYGERGIRVSNLIATQSSHDIPIVSILTSAEINRIAEIVRKENLSSENSSASQWEKIQASMAEPHLIYYGKPDKMNKGFHEYWFPVFYEGRSVPNVPFNCSSIIRYQIPEKWIPYKGTTCFVVDLDYLFKEVISEYGSSPVEFFNKFIGIYLSNGATSDDYKRIYLNLMRTKNGRQTLTEKVKHSFSALSTEELTVCRNSLYCLSLLLDTTRYEKNISIVGVSDKPELTKYLMDPRLINYKLLDEVLGERERIQADDMSIYESFEKANLEELKPDFNYVDNCFISKPNANPFSISIVRLTETDPVSTGMVGFPAFTMNLAEVTNVYVT